MCEIRPFTPQTFSDCVYEWQDKYILPAFRDNVHEIDFSCLVNGGREYIQLKLLADIISVLLQSA